jgi:D-arabinose 1-dehydrogenase-like Zn-dependent alcohol dehydrogenase
MGGAKAVFATAPDSKAIGPMMGGLAANGKLVAIGVSGDPLELALAPMIFGRLSVHGWYAGTSIDSEDTLAFSVLTGVRSMNEVYPLASAREAFARMMSGSARFRVVLEMPR